jgi:hypothetical protein
MQTNYALVSVLLLCFAPGLFAQQGLDSASQEALRATLEVMTSPSQRGEVIQSDAKALKANESVTSLMGSPENSEKLYRLASQIMESLAVKTGGDPDKMMQILDQAQRDPAAFAESFTEEQKASLRQLGSLVEKKQSSKKLP